MHTKHNATDNTSGAAHLCDKCSFSAPSDLVLKKHSKEHAPFAFSCGKCDYRTKTNNQLTRHITILHETKDPLLCDQCDFTTLYKLSMARHHTIVHKGIKFPCKDCDFTANFETNLSNHIRRTHKKETFRCDHTPCTYIANHSRPLKDHIRAVHEGISYPCPESNCNYKSGRSDVLKTHVKRVHKKKLDNSYAQTLKTLVKVDPEICWKTRTT